MFESGTTVTSDDLIKLKNDVKNLYKILSFTGFTSTDYMLCDTTKNANKYPSNKVTVNIVGGSSKNSIGLDNYAKRTDITYGYEFNFNTFTDALDSGIFYPYDEIVVNFKCSDTFRGTFVGKNITINAASGYKVTFGVTYLHNCNMTLACTETVTVGNYFLLYNSMLNMDNTSLYAGSPLYPLKLYGSTLTFSFSSIIGCNLSGTFIVLYSGSKIIRCNPNFNKPNYRHGGMLPNNIVAYPGSTIFAYDAFFSYVSAQQGGVTMYNFDYNNNVYVLYKQ